MHRHGLLTRGPVVLGIAVGVVGGGMLAASSADAFPSYFNEWKSVYPQSTLPAQLNSIGLSNCAICHHPPSFGDEGNCYRLAVRELLREGTAIRDAILIVGEQDPDNDGVKSRVEFVTPRSDLPGEIGYIAGLAGPLGVDPCFLPEDPVTGRSETPCLADVNRDDTLDFFDYLDFAQAFSDESPSADFNSDGVVDFFDYLDFAQAYDIGC
ncbi:MAG: hypothetical protein SFZ23_11625 [Planctomycetota bacterium]|nr:hypothetical protein [Planctomycetota bacterium]